MKTYSQFVSDFMNWKRTNQVEINFNSSNSFVWVIPELVKDTWKELKGDSCQSDQDVYRVHEQLLGIENLIYSGSESSKIRLYSVQASEPKELIIKDLLVTGIKELETGRREFILEEGLKVKINHPLKYSSIVLEVKDSSGVLKNRFKDYRVTDSTGILFPENEEDIHKEFIKGTIDYSTGILIIIRHNSDNEKRFELKRNLEDLDRITLTGRYSVLNGSADKIYEFDTSSAEKNHNRNKERELNRKDMSEILTSFMEKHAAYVRKKVGYYDSELRIRVPAEK